MDDDAARQRVLALRAEAERSVAELDRRIADVVAARADANGDDEHDPEGATIGFEWSQADALRAAARARVAAADGALQRIASGSYGVCSVCGQPIAPGRLEVRPLTARCVHHA